CRRLLAERSDTLAGSANRILAASCTRRTVNPAAASRSRDVRLPAVLLHDAFHPALHDLVLAFIELRRFVLDAVGRFAAAQLDDAIECRAPRLVLERGADRAERNVVEQSAGARVDADLDVDRFGTLLLEEEAHHPRERMPLQRRERHARIARLLAANLDHATHRHAHCDRRALPDDGVGAGLHTDLE